MKSKWIPTPLLRNEEKRCLSIGQARPPGQAGSIQSFLCVLRFLALLFSLRFRRCTVQKKAVMVRRFLERQGGLWIKVAQTLASRHDALPPVYCEELGKLFDSADAFPWEHAKQAIEGSMGRPMSEVFAEFSEEPIAAASIAQIYRAKLHHRNASVAVKVRRPNIEQTFNRDLSLLHTIATLLEKFESFRYLHPLDMYGELEQMVKEELDLRIESTLIRDMRRNLKPRGIYVPRVFQKYCTKEVLIMSFVQGVLMSDYLKILSNDPVRAIKWQDENKINPRKVARNIYLSCQRQVFEDNLFHGDLHPGNIMLLRKNRYALLDFGAVGSLDLNTRKQVMLYHEKIAEGDMSKAMMVLTHMSSPTPNINMAKLIRQLVRVTQRSLRIMTVKGLPYEERIYSDATSQQLRLIGKAKIPVSWDFLRAQRTFTVLEMSLRMLDPTIEPMKLSRRYFHQRAERVRAEAGGRIGQFIDHVEGVVADAQEVIGDMSEAKKLAGSILNRELNAVAETIERKFASIYKQAIIVLGSFLSAAVLEKHFPNIVPDWVRPILEPIANSLPDIPVAVWFMVGIAIIQSYRWASALGVKHSYR